MKKKMLLLFVLLGLVTLTSYAAANGEKDKPTKKVTGRRGGIGMPPPVVRPHYDF